MVDGRPRDRAQHALGHVGRARDLEKVAAACGGHRICRKLRIFLQVHGMAMTTPAVTITHATASDATRAAQLIFGIICMVMIANLQYGWTLFVNPIDQQYHWGRAAIQFAFTIFVLTETWLVPIEGYLIDRFGPRLMISASGVLVAIAWVINSIGRLAVPPVCRRGHRRRRRGRHLRRLGRQRAEVVPDRRGLAAGLTAAGFGAGSALTVIPIANMIQSSGYQSAFLWFGLGQGLVVLIVALMLRAPEAGEVPAPAARPSSSRGAITRLPRSSRRRSSGSCTRCSSWSAPAG